MPSATASDIDPLRSDDASGGGEPCSTLYSGCTYRGHQTSDDRRYEVEVRFKEVDLERSYLCGDLMIKGLTEQYPELTTFFDAEIIGQEHSFITRKWDANAKVDLQHWKRFPSFVDLEDKVMKPDFQADIKNNDYIFMRWKEHFLVPDHTVQAIKGASFAGFYYICFQRSTGTIEGLYYHAASEWFQKLNLKLVTERKFGAVDFR